MEPAPLISMPEHCQQIGVIHSPFKQKFGIPRQAGLIAEASGFVELLPPYNQPEALAGLDEFSHVWLLWQANTIERDRWKPTVRPPRLGGNQRVGVFASRSIFRPNAIGQSLVELDEIVTTRKHCGFNVSGLDILDGTPLIDIKPYLPWADALDDAVGGFANDKPESQLEVRVAQEAVSQFESLRKRDPQMMRLIERVIEQDPRPAFHQSGRRYGVNIGEYEVTFRCIEAIAYIISVAQMDEKG